MSKTYSQRPSSYLDVEDKWAAFQLDSAVFLVGAALDAAIEERVRGGTDEKPTWEKRYTARQLLDPKFKLPRADEEELDGEALYLTDGIAYDEIGEED
jgi:hypothetical protein